MVRLKLECFHILSLLFDTLVDLLYNTTLTSSEARYTHRWATSSAVHILPVFCLAMKSLYACGVPERLK